MHRARHATKLAAALAASDRLLHLPLPERAGRERIIVAYEYRCSGVHPSPDAFREPPWGRDDLAWPFDIGVVRREREIDELLEDRHQHADVLLLLARQRFLSENLARRESIAADLRRRIAVTE